MQPHTYFNSKLIDLKFDTMIWTQVFEELQGRIWYQIKGQSIYYWNICEVVYPKMGSKSSFGGFYNKSRSENEQNDIYVPQGLRFLKNSNAVL